MHIEDFIDFFQIEIQEVKSRLSIQRVLSHYGLKADKNGMMCCPFHDDKTPSMKVYGETHTVYCFSSNCETHGKSLDVIDLVMYMEKCSKHEAIQKATELVGGERSISRTALLSHYFQGCLHGMQRSKKGRAY